MQASGLCAFSCPAEARLAAHLGLYASLMTSLALFSFSWSSAGHHRGLTRGVASRRAVLNINDFANRQTSDQEPYSQYELSIPLQTAGACFRQVPALATPHAHLDGSQSSLEPETCGPHDPAPVACRPMSRV
jgi:hypothetical protein